MGNGENTDYDVPSDKTLIVYKHCWGPYLQENPLIAEK